MQLKFNFITKVKGRWNILSKNILSTKIPLHCQRYKNEDDFFKKNMYKDFPGGPVVKTVFPMQEVLV